MISCALTETASQPHLQGGFEKSFDSMDSATEFIVAAHAGSGFYISKVSTEPGRIRLSCLHRPRKTRGTTNCLRTTAAGSCLFSASVRLHKDERAYLKVSVAHSCAANFNAPARTQVVGEADRKFIFKRYTFGTPLRFITDELNHDQVDAAVLWTCSRVRNVLRSLHGRDCMTALCAVLDPAAAEGVLFRAYRNRNGDLLALLWTWNHAIDKYRQLSDVVFVDSTFNTNKWRAPLMVVVGVDRTYKNFVIAYAMIYNETARRLNWVFRTLADLAGGLAPLAIVSDREAAIASAVAAVYPGTYHFLCQWHLEQNLKLGDELRAVFRACMRSTTVDLFMQKWADFRERVARLPGAGGALANQVEQLDHTAHKWADCHLRRQMLCGALSSQRVESHHQALKCGHNRAAQPAVLVARTMRMEKRHLLERELAAKKGDRHFVGTPDFLQPLLECLAPEVCKRILNVRSSRVRFCCAPAALILISRA